MIRLFGVYESLPKNFGFVGHTYDLIMNCVTTTRFSIVANGKAGGFCVSERGLRQGCPLYPYLFILCSQGLTWLMRTI